jgi:DNA-binding LytR/AlgR family response regulator
MKVVIVEDETLAAEKLAHLLHKTDPGIEVIQHIESVEEAVNWFQQNPQPDLVFMDIQLDDGISFEIFDVVKMDAPVIFTTAYNEFAIRAFKVNSVDYLLKPIDETALLAALEKFRKHFYAAPDIESRIYQVFNQLASKYKTRFFVNAGPRFQSVTVEKTAMFFIEERSTFLQTSDGKNYDIDYSLDQVERMVNTDMFFRVNRNFLVNINFIHEIVAYSSSRLKIKIGGAETIVSREKVAGFKAWMDR